MAQGFRISIGNLLNRTRVLPVAASPSVNDTVYSIANIGSGYPDEPGQWAWNSVGTYRVDLDLNLLELTSDRVEAPTGFSDLTLSLAGTPGLGPFPPVYGTFGVSMNALKAFRPDFQDFAVMPGETVKVQLGLFLPDADGSNVTRVWAKLVDLTTGLQYDATAAAWNSSAVGLGETVVNDTWLDLNISVPANTARLERGLYRLILGMDSPAFGALSFAYYRGRAVDLSPTVIGPFNVAALVGHNIPFGATVTVAENGGEAGPTVTLTPAVPSFFGYTASETEQFFRFWRLTVQIDADLLAITDRPYIGELWMGKILDLKWCPAFPFVLEEEDVAQVRLAGGGSSAQPRTRRHFTEGGRTGIRLKMKFKANDAGYLQVRDVIQGGTRFGVDPMLFFPNSVLEGDVTFHGRVDKRVAFSRDNLQRRSFDMNVTVSLFPVVRT